MPKYRVSANLVWDVDGPESKIAETKAIEQLVQMANFAGIKLRKPKVSLSKLKDLSVTTTLKEYHPDDILKIISLDGHRREFEINGKVYKVKMNSQRYFCFAENKKCVACGIEGTKMLLELPHGIEYPHFNLYAKQRGDLVLMTKDHKIPVARGGKDVMENYQTMCAICNNIKGKDILHLEDLKTLREMYNKCVDEHVNSTQLHHMIQEEKIRLMSNRTDNNLTSSVSIKRLPKNIEKKLMSFSPTQGTFRLILLFTILLITFGIASYSVPFAGLGLVLAILGYLAGLIK